MRRGSSGKSLIFGLDKPSGITSFDAVNRCRRVFEEGRVGHTGTLDPLASGALEVCVGPATRLARFLVAADKGYVADIVFGTATDTDDAEGTVIRSARVPDELYDRSFAAERIRALVGRAQQVPPAYSAVKVCGVKSCDTARRGATIDLAPRAIEIFDAELVDLHETDGRDAVVWTVRLHVSKGTYVRSIARDLGDALCCPAHVGSLRRTFVGKLRVEDCVGLADLEGGCPVEPVDPLWLLGMRFASVEGDMARKVASGVPLEDEPSFQLYDAPANTRSSTKDVKEHPSAEAAYDGEQIAMLIDDAIAALYVFEEQQHRFAAQCVFNVGVSRG